MKTKSFLQLVVFLSILVLNTCHKNVYGRSLDNKSENETVTDIDGNTYKTITIGTQTWMIENLRVTKYRNGDPIATTQSPSTSIGNELEPKYHWSYPEGFATYKCTYYTWYALKDERQIAPQGWHIPSNEEWQILFSHIKRESEFENKKNSVIIFDHVAYCYRASNGSRSGNLEGTQWWSLTEFDEKQAYVAEIAISNENMKQIPFDKNNGVPIICVKDE